MRRVQAESRRERNSNAAGAAGERSRSRLGLVATVIVIVAILGMGGYAATSGGAAAVWRSWLALQAVPESTAITMAELHQGVAMARNALVRAARTEILGAAIVDFDPLPFDGDAATRYGTLVALTVAAKRNPKPRRSATTCNASRTVFSEMASLLAMQAAQNTPGC